jgi:hypothetical protein
MPVGGATITLTTWTGDASAAALLVVSDVNGTPTFIPAIVGSFDVAGVWTIAATVPSGLSGNVIKLETFGVIPTGEIDVSNEVAVSFQ